MYLEKLKIRFKLIKRNILLGSFAGTALIFSILLFFSIFMALPFVYAILQSIKPPEELFQFPPRFYVVSPTIQNFNKLFKLTNSLWVPFSRYIFNSIFVTTCGTSIHVIFASMAAYPLSKVKLPGSKLIFNIVIWSLLFTGGVTSLPQYIVMAKLGLINTYWSLILPSVGGSLGLFLMKQFIDQIHISIVESARIDGAGHLSVWWSIIMPITKPAWLTLIIFTFQALWNNTGGNLIFSEQLKVLPTVLTQISSSGISRMGVGAAATVILIIPPIVTFLFTQSNVIETMSYSGIKE